MSDIHNKVEVLEKMTIKQVFFLLIDLIKLYPFPYPSEARKNENHNYRNLTKVITWITALSNSMK